MYKYKIERGFEEDLLRAVYPHINTLFPRYQFKSIKNGKKWVSQYHLNGTKGSGGEQSYVLAEAPFFVGEWGASGMTIFQLVKQEGHGDNKFEQIKWLAEFCGLSIPIQDEKRFKEYQADKENKEAALKAFTRALWSGTPEALEVLEYIRARGWNNDDEIKRAELGYADEAIISGLADSRIFNVNTSGGDIGGTHRLVIPYKNGSSIFGFKFRDIHFKEEDKEKGARKYLNTLNLSKSDGLFGLSFGLDDIVVVEGELDALHAKVRGAARVVATTGNEVSVPAAQNAARMGVRRVTLLFDNDDAGRGFTKNSITNFNSVGITDIYVAELPDDVKDTDQYLATHEIADWNAATERAVPACVWKAKQTMLYYKQVADKNEDDKLTPKQQTDVVRYIRAIANSKTTRVHERPSIFKTIEEVTSRDDMRNAFDWLNMREVKAELDSENKVIADQKRAQATQEAGAKIAELLQYGDTDAALKVMRETSTQQDAQSEAAEFAEWFRPKSQAECEKMLSQITPGLPTGIRFDQPNDAKIHNGDLTLETGLTFVCANRSHGKTSFLNNIALNEATRNIKLGNNKSVLYFSYEISEQNLMLDLLNCYVNDADLSVNPRDDIRAYFSGDGTQYINTNRRDNFIAKKDKFFRNYYNGKRLIIIDKKPKVGKLLSSIKYYVSKYDVSLVCIDYAQLIYSEEYSRQRTEEIKRVVNEIKDFANEQGLPFLLAAQFNRQVISPVSVDTTKIGEGGDFERIADTCIGLFHLKELKSISHDEDIEIRKTLNACSNLKQIEANVPLTKIRDKIFVRLMKRRNGDFPMDTVLDWCGETKHITPNNPEALEVCDQQRELFNAEELQQPQQPKQPREPQEPQYQYFDDEAELTAQCADDEVPF